MKDDTMKSNKCRNNRELLWWRHHQWIGHFPSQHNLSMNNKAIQRMKSSVYTINTLFLGFILMECVRLVSTVRPALDGLCNTRPSSILKPMGLRLSLDVIQKLREPKITTAMNRAPTMIKLISMPERPESAFSICTLEVVAMTTSVVSSVQLCISVASLPVWVVASFMPASCAGYTILLKCLEHKLQ